MHSYCNMYITWALQCYRCQCLKPKIGLKEYFVWGFLMFQVVKSDDFFIQTFECEHWYRTVLYKKHFIALLVLVNLLFIVLDWYCISVSTHSLRCSICECFYRIMEHQIWQHTCVLYLQNAENEMHVISCRLCGAMEWSILLVVGHGLCQSAHSNHRVGLRAPADDVGVFLLWPSHPHLCVPGWCVVRHQRDQRRACV